MHTDALTLGLTLVVAPIVQGPIVPPQLPAQDADPGAPKPYPPADTPDPPVPPMPPPVAPPPQSPIPM